MDQRTDPLYQKDGQLYNHTSTISSLQPLSSLSPETQALFKPPEGTPYILTTPSTIFHAQGGGQPSDTGTITTTTNSPSTPTFHIHQVRKVDPAILHLGTFSPPTSTFPLQGEEVLQSIDTPKRLLHSRLHTAGHVLGLAISLLAQQATSQIPPSITDGKASHYPGSAFVECHGLIPSAAKGDIQAKVDELIAADLEVRIHFWSEERARRECMGGLLEGVKGDEVDGVRVVRVVEIGDRGRYACGGTHVRRLGECGKVVVRGVKRQKGVSKVSYEVQDV
ncbi:Nn.00g075080.m01.CDS01 [Neocucurbitaria sp. VM-36]